MALVAKSHSSQFPLFPTEPRTLAQAYEEYTVKAGQQYTVNLAEAGLRSVVHSLQRGRFALAFWAQLPQLQRQMQRQAHVSLVELQLR